MTADTGHPPIETATAWIFRRNDGIIKIAFKEHAEISLQNARDLLKVIRQSMDPISPLMVDGSRANFVSTRAQAEVFKTPNISGVAFIAPKWSDRITIENILKANQPIYPVMVFASEDEAIAWLKQFSQGSRKNT